MTELQWLIKLLTQHKLPPTLKDLFIERIGEVEASLSSAPVRRPNPIMSNTPVQAPSTQRILDEMANEAVPQAPVIARTIVPTEIITGKGNGTSLKGPRKF